MLIPALDGSFSHSADGYTRRSPVQVAAMMPVSAQPLDGARLPPTSIATRCPVCKRDYGRKKIRGYGSSLFICNSCYVFFSQRIAESRIGIGVRPKQVERFRRCLMFGMNPEEVSCKSRRAKRQKDTLCGRRADKKEVEVARALLELSGRQQSVQLRR